MWDPIIICTKSHWFSRRMTGFGNTELMSLLVFSSCTNLQTENFLYCFVQTDKLNDDKIQGKGPFAARAVLQMATVFFFSAKTILFLLQILVFTTNAKGSSAARTVSPVATEWVKSLLCKVMIIVLIMVVTIMRRIQKQPTTQAG